MKKKPIVFAATYGNVYDGPYAQFCYRTKQAAVKDEYSDNSTGPFASQYYVQLSSACSGDRFEVILNTDQI